MVVEIENFDGATIGLGGRAVGDEFGGVAVAADGAAPVGEFAVGIAKQIVGMGALINVESVDVCG